MKAPVVVEVAVEDKRAEPEDCLGAVEAPASAGDINPALDEVTASALDDPVAIGQPRSSVVA